MGASEQTAQKLMAELPGSEVASARPRLIPPSEKQERGELPPRMFVTSVDVEEGLWDSNQRKKKRQQKQKTDIQENEETYQDTTMLEEDVQLDYSDEAVGSALDWDRVEKGWDKFVALAVVIKLSLLMNVPKGLALNPLTFSPEVMLSLASVTRLPEASAEHQIIVIKPFSRFGSSDPSFSRRLAEPEEGEEEEMLEQEHTWDDILGSQWKIIKL